MEEKEIVFDEIKLGKFDFSGEVLFKYDVEREGDGFDDPIYSTVDIVSSEVIRLTKFDEDGDEVVVGESDFDEIYEQVVDLFYRQV